MGLCCIRLCVMNLLELLFYFASIILASFGAFYFWEFGVAASIGGRAAGLIIPLILCQGVLWIDEILFLQTREGRRRKNAETEFDKRRHDRISSWQTRPQKGKDGSFIVTTYYGKIITPRRAFYRFVDNSMIPEEITGDEAKNFIKVPLMR